MRLRRAGSPHRLAPPAIRASGKANLRIRLGARAFHGYGRELDRMGRPRHLDGDAPVAPGHRESFPGSKGKVAMIISYFRNAAREAFA